MDIERLQKLGLTRVEARIYLELLKLKDSLIGRIIKKTELHRGTVYNALNALIRKGFVSTIKTEKGLSYSPNKQILKELISQKQERIKEMKKISDEIYKIIETHPKKENTEVRVLSGNAGFRSFFKDLYNWAGKSKKEYFFIGRGNEMIDHFGEQYYKSTQEAKKRLGIKCRVLLNQNAQKEPVADIVEGNIRYVPWDHTSLTSTWIYDNKVVMVLWDSKPITTIIIKNEDAYKSYKSFFEELWESSLIKQKLLSSRHIINLYNFMDKAKESILLMDMNGFISIHEGREKIIELIKKGKEVRILLANPVSAGFIKRIKLEEKNLTDIKESRIYYEWKSAIANLKDVNIKVKHKLNLRLFDDVPEEFIMIRDDNALLYNKYSKKGKYGSSSPSLLLNKKLNKKEFNRIKKVFEKMWSKAKPIELNQNIKIEKLTKS